LSRSRIFDVSVCVLLTLGSGTLLAGSACDRVRSDPEADSEGRSVGDRDEGVESEGDSCSTDGDCSSYLRCRSGACRVPPAVDGEPGPDTPVVHFGAEGDAGSTRLYVELATTAEQRRRGLMHRPRMQRNWGMLFVFEREETRSFWMKDTLIPLDMIFMDAEGRVVRIVEEATPETTTPRRSLDPARFVLELNGGRAASAGIEPGDEMRVENIPEEYAPRR